MPRVKLKKKKRTDHFKKFRVGSELYKTYRWHKLSLIVRNEEPLCRMCGHPSECTDHIVPYADGGDFWDRSNLQALCKRCHRSKTGKSKQ